MGLDGVELVLEVEDRFRISLPREACARLCSVGDLAALVVTELSKVDGACPTAHSFFALRRAAAPVTRLPRAALRPRTPLERVAPRRGRRRIWRRLRRARPAVPRLRQSAGARGLSRAIGWTLVALWLAGTAALVSMRGGSGFALGLLLAPLTFVLWAWTASRLSTEFPDGCATLGDLARQVTPTPLSAGDAVAEQRVLDEVRRITAEQLGLALEDVKPESRFVDDLGLC